MHFVIVIMRWGLCGMSCSCAGCRLRILWQLANKECLTLLLQLLSNLAKHTSESDCLLQMNAPVTMQLDLEVLIC